MIGIDRVALLATHIELAFNLCADQFGAYATDELADALVASLMHRGLAQDREFRDSVLYRLLAIQFAGREGATGVVSFEGNVVSLDERRGGQ